MYPISFDTCTPWDVIRRSATVHPTLFADALFDLARTHRAYVAKTSDPIAKRAATNAGDDAYAAAEAVAVMPLPDAIADFIVSDNSGIGCMIQAFTVAVKLQAIPAATAREIAGRKPVRTH